MKILICTPLYPPDIEPCAMYTQELARRLAETHEVTVLTYGFLPESTEHVHIVSVPKEYALPIRLVRFTQKLFVLARASDAIIVENGPSVELPIFLASLFIGVRPIFHESDTRTQAKRKRNPIHALLHTLVRTHSSAHLFGRLPERPEIMPFKEPPTALQAAYESDWTKHLAEVNEFLKMYA